MPNGKAGMLVYVGATHLLPKVEQEPKKIQFPCSQEQYFRRSHYCFSKGLIRFQTEVFALSDA
ncbi:MAG: hypothetical protein GVY17_08675 [Cyanobacteria bacterium]|jgi:hypothetical protein|nr:hypothetical protein [Cyanobacteria bacterium GSL.Bin21]